MKKPEDLLKKGVKNLICPIIQDKLNELVEKFESLDCPKRGDGTHEERISTERKYTFSKNSEA